MHSVHPANPNPQEVVRLCREALSAIGFTERKKHTIWRRTNVKFDVIKFDIVPRGRCQKWRVPFGSFGLDPSCLFPFLPRLGHAPSDGWEPNKGFGQVRLSVYRRISQPRVNAPNLWWTGDGQIILEKVVRDVLDRIAQDAIPFFSRFDDIHELLRTYLEDEDMMGREGIWELGKKESARRLLYTGFTAIACGTWDLAISSLEACREKTWAIPPPLRESVQAEMLPYIDQGLICAKERRPWPAS